MSLCFISTGEEATLRQGQFKIRRQKVKVMSVMENVNKLPNWQLNHK